jgi:hypothetical protein
LGTIVRTNDGAVLIDHSNRMAVSVVNEGAVELAEASGSRSIASMTWPGMRRSGWLWSACSRRLAMSG